MQTPPRFQSWPPFPASPPDESGWARLLRWIEDRQNLAELDDRLLRDVGLTREDVARNTPFARGETGPRAGRRPTVRADSV